jgi:hypothetical protein
MGEEHLRLISNMKLASPRKRLIICITQEDINPSVLACQNK